MKKLNNNHIFDRTGSFPELYDMFAEAYNKDDPEEAAKCRKIAQELRNAEDRNS